MFGSIGSADLKKFLFCFVYALLGEFDACEYESVRPSVIIFSTRTHVFIRYNLLTFAGRFDLGDDFKFLVESVFGFPGRGVDIVAIVVDKGEFEIPADQIAARKMCAFLLRLRLKVEMACRCIP